MKNRLTTSVSVSSCLFVPAGTGSEKRHRLRVRARYAGKNPAQLLTFCTEEASGEPLRVTFRGLDGADGDAHAQGRLAHVRCPVFKGDKIPPVDIVLVFEGEDVEGIQTVLGACLLAARGELLEVDLVLQPVQDKLPGMNGAELDADAREDEERTAAGELPLAERAAKGPRSTKRPKGSSPAPRA